MDGVLAPRRADQSEGATFVPSCLLPSSFACRSLAMSGERAQSAVGGSTTALCPLYRILIDLILSLILALLVIARRFKDTGRKHEGRLLSLRSHFFYQLLILALFPK